MSKRFYKFVINILAPELSINIFKSELVLNENINSRVMASFFRYFDVIRLLLDTRNIIFVRRKYYPMNTFHVTIVSRKNSDTFVQEIYFLKDFEKFFKIISGKVFLF